MRAAMAHFNLVKIHPWSDGNGRMSRSLQTLLVSREGVLAPEFSSIEAWLGRPGHTWDYCRVLSEVGGSVYSPNRDTTPWMRFNLRAYHEQTPERAAPRPPIQHVLGPVRRAARTLSVTERQVTALREMAMTGRVRRARYGRAVGITEQQARRDLQHLMCRDLLKAVGNTKGRYYVRAIATRRKSWPLLPHGTPSETSTTALPDHDPLEIPAPPDGEQSHLLEVGAGAAGAGHWICSGHGLPTLPDGDEAESAGEPGNRDEPVRASTDSRLTGRSSWPNFDVALPDARLPCRLSQGRCTEGSPEAHPGDEEGRPSGRRQDRRWPSGLQRRNGPHEEGRPAVGERRRGPGAVGHCW